MKIYSNIVPENVVRKKQLDTLNIISNAIEKSFGPMGSHTALAKAVGNSLELEYTKDGHTIVSNMVFKDTIEISVQQLISDLTRHIVKEVGDGTTSTVLLANIIFKELCKYQENHGNVPEFKIIESLTEAVNALNKFLNTTDTDSNQINTLPEL